MSSSAGQDRAVTEPPRVHLAEEGPDRAEGSSPHQVVQGGCLSPQAMVDVALLIAVVGFVLAQLRPALLVAVTTPAGGDMGAHVWTPAYLRDHLLPHGRLSGWAPDWYAGFPALTFYFPLPAVVIVALSLIVPYQVAFKLVSVVGLLTLPLCAYLLGRLVGLRFPGPALFALATLPFLFDRFHTIYGGNIAATLAGEFSFSISLSLALVFLGVFARGLETGEHRALAAALLAGAGLSHLLPTLFALAGAGVLLALRFHRSCLRYALTCLPVAGALGVFWWLPFLWRLPYTNDMGWEKITAYTASLLPFLSHCAIPGACQPNSFPWSQTWHLLPVTALAVASSLAGLLLRRRVAVFLAVMAALSAAVFVLAPPARLWNARALPFWFLSLYLLAAWGLCESTHLSARWFEKTLRRRPVGDGARNNQQAPLVLIVTPLAWLLVVSLFVALPLGSLPRWLPLRTTDHSFIPDWVAWNYSGYERKPAYGEYHAVVAAMADVGRRHGCGRALWEYEPGLDRYGTPMALMLLPYWTNGCISSMEGLFFESAATTPYHFLMQSELSKQPSRAQRGLPYRSLNLNQGVKHLQLLGVRYYMALSPEAITAARARPELSEIASSGPWRVFQVDGAELVTSLSRLPAVLAGWPKSNRSWLEVAVPWFQDPLRWEVPLAESGEAEWPMVRPRRLATASQTLDAETIGARTVVSDVPSPPVSPARAHGIRTGDDRISFDVDRVGSPMLVKASYFPNWRASGARGPWRVTPNLMVVVPTHNHVELHYGWTPVERAGLAITLVGIVALVLLSRSGPLTPRARVAGEARRGWSGPESAAPDNTVSEGSPDGSKVPT